LADIRKDDVAARYKRAEQSRLAAELRKNPAPAGVDTDALMLPADDQQRARSRFASRIAWATPLQRHAIWQRILSSFG
jgi:hypothetical protein